MPDRFRLCDAIIEDRYRVEEVIRDQPSAVLYRGRHLRFEERIAIECVRVPPDDRRRFLLRFREAGARLARRPCRARLLDFGVAAQGGTEVAYLALEWPEGMTLDALLAERPSVEPAAPLEASPGSGAPLALAGADPPGLPLPAGAPPGRSGGTLPAAPISFDPAPVSRPSPDAPSPDLPAAPPLPPSRAAGALRIGAAVLGLVLVAGVAGGVAFVLQIGARQRARDEEALALAEARRRQLGELARQAAEEDARRKEESERPAAGMASIPGGTFLMGSADGAVDERPVRRVTVAAFELDVTEVTVAAYQRCVEEGACTPASAPSGWGQNGFERDKWTRFCNFGREDRRDHPINCVSWAQAEGFCRAAGKRLPTEEEWEHAARGAGEQRTFPWGAAIPSARRANACDKECATLHAKVLRERHELMFGESDGWESTAPVGSYPEGASRQGVQDLAGNVWEWTASAYCLYGAPACSERGRVLRGGGWRDGNIVFLRASDRASPAGGFADNGDIGFRCARTPGARR